MSDGVDFDLELSPKVIETIRIKIGDTIYPVDTLTLLSVLADFSKGTLEGEPAKAVGAKIGIPDLNPFQLLQLAQELPKKINMEALKKNLKILYDSLVASRQEQTGKTGSSTGSPVP